MKFTLEREALNEILKQIKGVAPTKPIDPVHGDILISIEDDGAGGALARFNVVDRNFAIHLSVIMGVVKFDDFGVMAMPASKISELASKAYADEMRFTYDEQRHSLKVKAGKRTATIKGHAPDDFPTSPRPKTEPIQIHLDLLGDAVFKVVHAASLEREMTMGVYFEIYEGELTTACLDGQRVAASFNRELPGNPEDVTAFVRANEMKQVVTLFDALSNVKMIDFYIEDNYVYLASDNIMARVSRISSQFPDFRLMFPEDISSGFLATVGTRSLLSAIDWGSTVDSVRIELDFLKEGEIRVSSYDKETGNASEAVQADIKGSTTSILTFASHLLTQLRLMVNMGYDQITLHAAGNSMPLVICPVPDDDGVGSDYQAIVMPLSGKTRYQEENA